MDTAGRVRCIGGSEYGLVTGAPSGVFVDLALGDGHACVRTKAGGVSCWGDRTDLDDDEPAEATMMDVAVGRGYAVALRDDGVPRYFGEGGGRRFRADRDPFGPFVDIDMNDDGACALEGDDTVVCWGATWFVAPDPSGVERLDGGLSAVCGVEGPIGSNGGGAWCWGRGEAVDANRPVLGLDHVTVGYAHGCGREVPTSGDAGRLNCWGNNDFGQSTEPSGDWAEVVARGDHTCARKLDGSVSSFGTDGSGESSPPALAFSALGAGDDYTCGVRESDDLLQCWGATSSFTVSVPTATTMASVVGGGGLACGISSGGNVSCFGRPAGFVGGLPGGSASQVAIGPQLGCVVRPGGMLVCFGDPDVVAEVPASGSFTEVAVVDVPKAVVARTSGGDIVAYGELRAPPWW